MSSVSSTSTKRRRKRNESRIDSISEAITSAVDAVAVVDVVDVDADVVAVEEGDVDVVVVVVVENARMRITKMKDEKLASPSSLRWRMDLLKDGTDLEEEDNNGKWRRGEETKRTAECPPNCPHSRCVVACV